MLSINNKLVFRVQEKTGADTQRSLLKIFSNTPLDYAPLEPKA